MMTVELWMALAAFALLLVAWLFLPGHGMEEGRPAPNGAPAVRAGVAANGRRGLLGMRIERNPAGESRDTASPRYFVTADLGGLAGFREVRIPIFWRPAATAELPRKETYHAQIAEADLEAGNLIVLETDIETTLLRLLQHQRLPRYWFVLPRGGMAPVYVQGRYYEVSVRRGPQFAAQRLAAARDLVRDYCRAVGTLAADDSIGIRALGDDLRRMAPLAVLEADGIWLPVFAAGRHLRVDGMDLTIPAVELRSAGDLLRLRAAVAAELVRIGRLVSDAHLAIADVSDEMWAGILAESVRCDHELVVPERSGRGRLTLPVMRFGDTLVCVPNGVQRLLVGGDLWGLAEIVGIDMDRRGIARREDVSVHHAGPTRVGVR